MYIRSEHSKEYPVVYNWGISSGGEELAACSSDDVISGSMKKHPVKCSV
jgi:hypothetical protein